MWLGSAPSSVVTSVLWSCSDAGCNFGPHWPYQRWQTMKWGHSPGFCQYIIKKTDRDTLLCSWTSEWAVMLPGRLVLLTPAAGMSLQMLQLPSKMLNGLNCELATVKFKHTTSSRLQTNASSRDVVTIFYPVGNFSKFILCLSSTQVFEN